MGGVIGSAPSFTDVWARNLCKGFRNPFLTEFQEKRKLIVFQWKSSLSQADLWLSRFQIHNNQKQIILLENKGEDSTKKALPPPTFIAAKQKHVDLS